MNIKTKPFNPFEYLETEEEIREYMQSAWEDEDSRIFIVALSHWVKHHGVAEVAESTGLNRESLYKTLSGKTQPKWETVHKLWHMLKRNYAI
ncbi:MAG: addiction module antidote protein [Ostreibacterium sp.]